MDANTRSLLRSALGGLKTAPSSDEGWNSQAAVVIPQIEEALRRPESPQQHIPLRDYFAGQALAGNCGFATTVDGVTADQLAEEAYTIADAMLAAREKGTN